MNIVKKVKCVVVILLLELGSIANAEYFNSLSMKDGLSQSSVLSVYQDILGRIWVGTLEGITVYDGEKMVSYKPWAQNHMKGGARILVGNDIPMITGDKYGNIFLMSDHSLLKYDIYLDLFERICDGNVNAITSHSGECWSLIGDSVFFYNNANSQLEFRFKTELRQPRNLLVSDSKIWVGCLKGLYSFSKEGKEKECILPNVEIWKVYESSKRELWVGCVGAGAYKISTDGEVTEVPYASDPSKGISSKTVRAFCEDNSGNIWIGTFNGLFKYNPFVNTYSRFCHEPRAGALTHSSIYALFKDKQGTVWIGTYYGGLNYVNPESELFTHYTYDPTRTDGLNFPFVGNMVEDRDENLWICLDGGGLNCLNRKENTFTRFVAGTGNALLHNNLRSICYDPKRDCLYIGTHEGGLSKYDRRKKTFHHYLPEFKGWASTPNAIIDQVTWWKDQLIVSARNGIFMMNPDTEEFTLIKNGVYRCFDVDQNGYIWFADDNKLYRLNLNNPADMITFDLTSIGCCFRVIKIFIGRDNNVYVGTSGSGLFIYESETLKFTNYTTENSSLLSNYCYNIIQTKQGNVLITSDKGITLFNLYNKAFRSMNLGMGLSISSIIDGCGAYACSNNQVYIGGTDGLISFWEEDFCFSSERPKFYFSNMFINNMQVFPGDPNEVLGKALAFTEKLDLRHDQNNLTFNFATSNFVDILTNKNYEYKLEGFDKNWISTDKTTVHYTNLDPGTYTLFVREKGNSLKGRFLQEISLPFVIHPAWYCTWIAICVYIVALSFLSYWLYRIRRIRRRLALSLEMEKLETQKLTEINQAKLRFFINVSHEFRTPLTLIISRIDMLMQSSTISPLVSAQIRKIDSQARRLRDLVSDLLDFRKLDQSGLILHVGSHNVNQFLNDLYISFSEYALSLEIEYKLDVKSSFMECYFDSKQMERVISNLISNAFKYTPKGGRITIQAEESNETVSVQVKDSGIGIQSSELNLVFERFYQGGNGSDLVANNPGTGIGLALAKSLVLAHHGDILVDSAPEQGSCFTVVLQKGTKHFIDDKNVVLDEVCQQTQAVEENCNLKQQVRNIVDEEEVALPEDGSSDGEHYKILLVEDNEELLQILSQLFSPLYQVILARNGMEGLNLIYEEKPDLVVSDVMMPIMSGSAMCLQVKSNIDYCHIPIILLTALDGEEQSIEGYKSGADDYVTKPFNAKILLVRCNNLIRSRKLMQAKYTKEKDADINLLATNPMDKRFLDMVIQVIDEHLSEEDFDISFLCREVGMSRTSLHTKFKALTNMTPNDFIILHKLKLAAEMLKRESHLQIVEISEKLGFGSPRYFSRCFKNQFGVSPQHYKKKE